MPATLKVTAIFNCTLGSYIWQTFSDGNNKVDADQFWQIALDVLADQANWDLLYLGTPQELSKLASLPASASVPEDFASCTTPTDWLAVDASARPLLLLMRTYMQSVVMTLGITPEACMTANIGEVTAQLVKSQSHINREPRPSDASCHIRKLRAALLLIKLASVVGTINRPDSQLQRAMRSLLTAFGTMAIAIQQQADKKRVRDSEVEEAQELSLHIVKMAIPVLKQVVKTTPTGSFCCCLMLKHLMLSNKPAVHRVVASELIKGGWSLVACLLPHTLSASCCSHTITYVYFTMPVCLLRKRDKLVTVVTLCTR